TGREVWKFYTVPGDPAKGFVESSAMRKAAATWAGEWWKLGGGGAVWDGISYDPESELLYVGTGNAEPWPQALRTREAQARQGAASRREAQARQGAASRREAQARQGAA